MALHLDRSDILEAAYHLLHLTRPFRSWRELPAAEDVEFRIVAAKDCFGWHNDRRKKWGKLHIIGISANSVGLMTTLLPAMAHEMCHIPADACGERAQHGREFQRRWGLVCRYYRDFDPKAWC